MENELLKNAFLEFSRASESLVTYYTILEKKVQALRKEVEKKNEELKRAKGYLATILNSIPIAVAVKDGEKLIFSNRKAAIPDIKRLLRDLKLNGKREGEIKLNGRSYRWIREILSIEGKKNELLLVEDVTEMEKMKERLKIDEKLKAMGEMALKIAHEVKNPLASMELFASMLLMEIQDERLKGYVEQICVGIKNINRIVSNILAYTRPKALSLKEGFISDVINEILEFMKPTFGKIEVIFENEEKEKSLFDPHLLSLVIINLLTNAKEAIGDKGLIRIGLKEDGSYKILSVRDSGVGMDEETRRNIFNPFFTTKDHGVGLGLFIVYNIVKAHKGEIEVESYPKKGTEFRLYLPLT